MYSMPSKGPSLSCGTRMVRLLASEIDLPSCRLANVLVGVAPKSILIVLRILQDEIIGIAEMV